MDQLTWDDKDSGLPESDPRRNWRVVDILELKTKFNDNVEEAETELDTAANHIANTSNPHSVTKTQVGLGNVDNTSDANKEVSGPQQTAINAKVADAINNGTTTIAPSQNAVFDALALKQDVLVSATNVKTVNGNSILGSGDIDLIDDAIVNGETKAPSQNAVFDALALKANVSDVPLTTTFVDNEILTGTKNGINLVFTLANTPITGSVHLFNVIYMVPIVDYTISGNTITFVVAPDTGSNPIANYRK